MLRHSVDPLGALSSPSESLTVTSTHKPYCHASVLLGGALRYVLDLSWSFNSIVFGEDRHSCAGLNDKRSREVHTRTQQVASPPKQGRDFPTTLAIPMISLSLFDDQYIKSDPSIMTLSYPSLFGQWISLIKLIMLGPLALVGII